MADKYKYFYFKNESSQNYNAIIKNEGSDLKFFNTPSFSDEIVYPKFGNISYLLGTNKENREISLDLILIERTIKQYREFLN
jgi:hypothetical protein